MNTLTPALRSNILHYYLDIAWWALYAGTILPFLSVYAVRNGASNAQLGLLSAAPAGIALILSLPVGRWVRRFDVKRVTVISLLIQRIIIVCYALLPWLLPSQAQVEGVIILTTLIAIPGAAAGITFNQLLMDAVPPQWRGQVVGMRIAIFSILTFFVTLLSGFILENMPSPAGYQVIFFIGFIGAIMTTYHLSRVEPLISKDPPPAPPDPRSERILPSLDSTGRHYLVVLLLVTLFNTVNNLVVPLIPPFAVNQLGLSDQMYGIGSALNVFFVFLVSLLIARLTRWMGNRAATAAGAFLLVMTAVIMSFAQDASFYLLAMGIGGIASGILTTAQFNYVLDAIPLKTRSAWFAINMLVGNAAILIGSLGGPLLAGVISVPIILLIVAGLRLMIGLALLKWG